MVFQNRKGPGYLTLDCAQTILNLPAMKICAVVLEDKTIVHSDAVSSKQLAVSRFTCSFIRRHFVSNCLLPCAYCLLHCLQLTAFCILLTAFCLPAAGLYSHLTSLAGIAISDRNGRRFEGCEGEYRHADIDLSARAIDY